MNEITGHLEAVVMGVIATAGTLLHQQPVVGAPGEVPAEALAQAVSGSIVDNSTLRLWCIIGALGGGYLATALFAEKDATAKTRAVKLSTSSLVSVMFTPSLFSWVSMSLTPDHVLMLSGAVAIIGVGVIRGLVTGWTKFFINRFGPPVDDRRGPPNNPS